MTVKNAREIIAQYGKLLGELTEQQMFLGEHLLPCSKPRIRFAIYYYIVVLIRMGPSQKETIESLMIAYSHLGFFTTSSLANDLNQILQNRENRSGHVGEKMDQLAEDLRRLNKEKGQLLKEIQAFVREEIVNKSSDQTLFN